MNFPLKLLNNVKGLSRRWCHQEICKWHGKFKFTQTEFVTFRLNFFGWIPVTFRLTCFEWIPPLGLICSFSCCLYSLIVYCDCYKRKLWWLNHKLPTDSYVLRIGEFYPHQLLETSQVPVDNLPELCSRNSIFLRRRLAEFISRLLNRRLMKQSNINCERVIGYASTYAFCGSVRELIVENVPESCKGARCLVVLLQQKIVLFPCWAGKTESTWNNNPPIYASLPKKPSGFKAARLCLECCSLRTICGKREMNSQLAI